MKFHTRCDETPDEKHERTKQYKRKYNISDKGHIAKKRYRQSKKGMATRQKYWQSEHYLNYKKKYAKTKVCKQLSRKTLAKRRQRLGYIEMFINPFADNIKVEWHHINDVYVVAVPKEIHRLSYGKNHREQMMNVVKQIYL